MVRPLAEVETYGDIWTHEAVRERRLVYYSTVCTCGHIIPVCLKVNCLINAMICCLVLSLRGASL